MIPIFAIKAETARHYGVAPGQIDGRDRVQEIAFPRNVAMTIARDLTDYSFPELGRQFGGRDHTTVQRNVKVIRHMAACRPEVRESLDAITARLVSDHMPIFKSSRATQRSAEA